MVEEIEGRVLENKKAFHLNAEQLSEFQNITQNMIGKKLKFDDYMSMFQADVMDMF